MTRRDELARNLAEVRHRIDDAAQAVDRDPSEVQLVVVTKTFPASDVALLAELGVKDVAENRDQEARAKAEALTDRDLRWHMIGQLQRNKANSVARWADVVESVDRVALVAPLSHAAEQAGRTLQCLVQVCLDPEPGRGGAMPEDVLELCAHVADAAGLVFRGLMAVAPYPGDPDEAFARLESVRKAVLEAHPAATVLSAGMSGDLEAAVRHGATQVRIGGAILGARPPVA
jgi:PLP dependent protein